MNLNFVAIGVISGLILTFLIGVIWHKSYDNLMSKHWIPQTIIFGLISIPLLACIGKIDDTNICIKKSIKNTITANYDNILNYHNDNNNKSFVSDNLQYTFDYDEKTNTLITINGSSVDATFVDGVKQKNSK